MAATDPDVVAGVPWRWVATPNHGAARARTLGVFIHSTRGGPATLEEEYQRTVRFCAGPNAQQVGPSFVVGPSQVTRMCHDADTCWCQTVDNPLFLGIEVAQPTASTAYVEFQYRAAADLVARLAIKYGFPIRRLPRQTTPTVQTAGIIGHEDSRAGWERGKTDPGYRWDWPKFIAMCQAKHAELTAVIHGPMEGPMTASEKATCAHIADVVLASNSQIEARLKALDALVGPTPLATEIRAQQFQIHNHAVHNLRVLAGIEAGRIVD